MSFDYKKAGVDVEAGDALVDWLSLSDSQKMPHSERLVSGIGGFASLFKIDFPEMKNPCIVTCTDGVGTKVKLASHFHDFSTIGQDLVAMCVNDLICTGGLPLLFLDYYATSRLDLVAAKAFLTGVKKACLESSCALVGGETAEMPGVYHGNDFDCAGFAVGIVDQEKTLGPSRVKDRDVLVGVSSSGFHSNGYSLLRKVFEADLENWREILMRPTHLYVELLKNLKQHEIELHAISHITGGGVDNIPRVLPEGAKIHLKEWDFPAEFMEVQKRTGLTRDQMLKTLNCGVGLVLVIPASQERQVKAVVETSGFRSIDVGWVQI